jgi:hypothetical protein
MTATPPAKPPKANRPVLLADLGIFGIARYQAFFIHIVEESARVREKLNRPAFIEPIGANDLQRLAYLIPGHLRECHSGHGIGQNAR